MYQQTIVLDDCTLTIKDKNRGITKQLRAMGLLGHPMAVWEVVHALRHEGYRIVDNGDTVNRFRQFGHFEYVIVVKHDGITFGLVIPHVTNEELPETLLLGQAEGLTARLILVVSEMLLHAEGLVTTVPHTGVDCPHRIRKEAASMKTFEVLTTDRFDQALTLDHRALVATISANLFEVPWLTVTQRLHEDFGEVVRQRAIVISIGRTQHAVVLAFDENGGSEILFGGAFDAKLATELLEFALDQNFESDKELRPHLQGVTGLMARLGFNEVARESAIACGRHAAVLDLEDEEAALTQGS